MKRVLKMNIDINLVYRFKLDVLEYLFFQNRIDFKMHDFFDEEERVYFFFHNDEELDSDKNFKGFIVSKMNEYFFSNNIFNICFAKDFIFTEWSNVETISESLEITALRIIRSKIPENFENNLNRNNDFEGLKEESFSKHFMFHYNSFEKVA